MNFKICRICLRTEAKVYKFEDRYQLKSYYEEVLASKVNEKDGLPHYFCYECAYMLYKFHKFKERCYIGQKVLKKILWRGPITYEAVQKIDLAEFGLQPLLETNTLANTSTVKEIYLDDNIVVKSEGPIVDLKHDEKQTDTDGGGDDQDDVERMKDDELSDSKRSSGANSPTILNIKKDIELKKRPAIQKRKRRRYTLDGKESNIKEMLVTSKFWQVCDLNEEEAITAFKERAESKKYLDAAYKCTNCFKGFSKETILKRHMKLRHSESLGKFECRFCHVRFKLDCFLKRHMRQHFEKYKCLRCSLVCDLEYTAFLHDECHSGVARKCVYCDQEFRHSSTYYTHLRRHRSEFVCALCGASFVSNSGLRQHKRVTHVIEENDIEDDDDEDLNTFCSRCDIKFETRKAFKEHLFHSVMHTEELEEIDDDETMPRKVLGKKMQSKITNDMEKNNKDLFPPAYKKSKWGRSRKCGKKPTTCHQCGKSFETQAACMKHHVAEHPRTSFFPPTDRHICEICGASLAPGSVASHQNMHTKEKMHSCSTCNKQFHSSVSYRRHLLTHTGEKPYGCTLCDKRFTQSNSMKLHFRTFHLKEPYPKRNRRKKTDLKEPQGPTATESESEQSASDAEPPPPPPAAPLYFTLP